MTGAVIGSYSMNVQLSTSQSVTIEPPSACEYAATCAFAPCPCVTAVVSVAFVPSTPRYLRRWIVELTSRIAVMLP